MEYADRFGRLSVYEQGRLKAELASRRLAVGGDEASRHDAWVEQLGDHGYRARSSSRAVWFAQQSKPLQIAYVQQWREHRERFKVPVGPTLPVLVSRELADIAGGPTGADSRDEQHLRYEQTSMLVRDEDSGLTA